MKSHTMFFLIIAFLAVLTEKVTYARLDFDSIDKSGFYRLSDDLDNTVTISVGDVTFDLGGHTIAGTTSGIVVNTGLDQVTIQNGVVEAAQDAILVNSGCSNIQLKNITAKNAIRGINFDGVADSTIIGCEMTQNTTGLELDSSHKIVVKDCVAMRNTHGGYCLLSSSTNTFENCKALNTGEGNTDLFDTTIFGFVTSSGYANIFERCIANATQGLTTTDADSIIAGFAFRGTEQCSKIIECEAANSTSAAAGLTLPYGILLEARFDGLVSVTSVNPDEGSAGDSVTTVNWSPDGKYLAVGGALSGTTDNDLFVYRFDRNTQTLIEVDSVNPDDGASDTVRSVNWSPDGTYLAVGGAITGTTGNDLFVYRFDRNSETLTEVDSVNPDDGATDIRTVNWSPDGTYLAIGGTISGTTGNDLFVYRFDRNTQTLIEVDSVNPDGGASDTITAVNWSPDDTYLAVGGTIGGTTDNDLFVYRFDRNTQTLIEVDSVNPDGGGVTDAVTAVNWSPDGKYLAIGGTLVGTTNNDLFVYRFDRNTETLIEVDSVNPDEGGAADTVNSVNWSADGTFLAVGGSISGTTDNDLFIYRFDRNTQTLIEVDSVNPDGGADDSVGAVNWSPDGVYLAVGGTISGTTDHDLFVYSALQFPEKNVIKNNTVYCNSGNVCPGGVGISGSSIANLILGNTAYSNPIGPEIISMNYQFVTNIFAQSSGLSPSLLQNVAIACDEPICEPDRFPARLRRIELLVESLIENLL